MATKIEADIYARDRTASNTFDKVGSSAVRNSGHVRKFGGVLVGALAGGALYQGGKDLVQLFGDLAEGAAEDEGAAIRLARQLRNSAGATDAQVASTEDWITAQGAAIGIADDELRPALARAVVATKDVSAAQDLVSLSMDVAAGKGKSLATINEALAKGAQGNVSGLSRLGIATKDAEGKTRSFNDITKELAATYSGQAAAAADTAGGRYERLKVQFSELGEEVGYALLPVLNDFGSWILDEGVPASQKLVHWVGDEVGPAFRDAVGWVKDNKDEFADLGGQIVDTVVPALRDTAEVVGDVVGWFMQLPSPVRNSALEIAAGAAAVSKLSGAVGSMNIGGFVGNLRNAETRAAAMESATTRLSSAARTAAGGAGLALLMDGAQRTDGALGSLEMAAGGAAAGFAVGGPWGAAIGGGAGLVYGLATKFGDAERKAEQAYEAVGAYDPVKEANKVFADLAGTLDQVTGGYTSATRAAVLKELQDNKTIEAGVALGLTQRQLVNAALGQGDAMRAVTPLLSQYEGQVTSLDEQIAAVKNSTDSYAQATAVSGKGVVVATGHTNELTGAAKAQITELQKQRNAAAGNLETLRGMAGTLKESAAETRANAAATAEYGGQLKGLPKSLVTEIKQAGIEPSKDAIAELARRYDLARKDVKTLVKVSGADTSAAAVQRLIEKLNAADRDREIYITTHYNIIGNKPKAPLPGGDADRVVGGSSGRTLGDGMVADLMRGKPKNQADLTKAGADLLASLVSGIGKGKKPLDSILDQVREDMKTKLDNVQRLVEERASFADSFVSWRTSLFSMASSTDAPLTLDALFAQSAANLAQSGQVRGDVSKLIGMGVSKDFLDQLQSQGQSGLEALHLLAGASADQIATLNAENAATIENYQAAGVQAWSQIHGDELQKATQLANISTTLMDAVRALDSVGGKFEFVLKGDDLVAVIKKKNKRDGKKDD